MDRILQTLKGAGLVFALALSLSFMFLSGNAAWAKQAGVTHGKLDKDIKCKERRAYKEVMPGITDYLTAEPAARTAIGWERYDIEEGRAKVIDRQVSCVGLGLVVCTAVVTLCYN